MTLKFRSFGFKECEFNISRQVEADNDIKNALCCRFKE